MEIERDGQVETRCALQRVLTLPPLFLLSYLIIAEETNIIATIKVEKNQLKILPSKLTMESRI